MNAVKLLEKILAEWEADYDEASAGNKSHYNGGVLVIEQAIRILKEPPNQENTTDKKPKCCVCDWGAENRIYDNYCGCCGGAFDR